MIPYKVRMKEDLFAILSTFLMETIHVELPDEAIDLIVPEVFRQDMLLESFYISDVKLFS